MRTFIIIAVIFILASCKKDDTCKQGTVRFTCTSNNPYMIFVDGGTSIDLVPAKQSVDKKISRGKHTLKAEQKSGFLLFPTVKTLDVDIKGCDQQEFIFP